MGVITAEWWINECGGVFCSRCGMFYDDYHVSPPKQCPGCGSQMITNSLVIIDKRYRLSRMFDKYYMDEIEYPDWLLKLRSYL